MKNGNGRNSNRHSQGNERERDNNGRFASDDDNRASRDYRGNRNNESDQDLMDWDQNDRRGNYRQNDHDNSSNRSSPGRSDSDYSNSNRNNRNRNYNSDGGSYGHYSGTDYESGNGSFSGSNYSSAGFGGGNYGVGNYGGGTYGTGSSGIGNVSNYGSGTRGTAYQNDWSDTEETSSRNKNSQRGKGPKGYKRSDDRIQEDINDKLTDDHQLDASNIEVKVESGEVTLSGTVSDRNGKRRAEDIAETVSGVINVQNSIRINKNDTHSSDSASTQDGKHKTNGKH